MRFAWWLPLALVAVGCGGTGLKTTGPVPGTTTTVAGSDIAGAVDGPAAGARFNNPVNVAVDSDGTIFVCDFDNGRVRRIRSTTVSTLAMPAGFDRPFGITIGADGFLYVQTDANDTGARDETTGTIWRVSKSGGASTVVVRNVGRPRGLLALPDGRIVMSDIIRHKISILDPGTGAVTALAGQEGEDGYADGTGAAARFSRPYGLARLSDGSILVADQDNNRIRRVTLGGVVTTFAGSGVSGRNNGSALSATFDGPQDVDVAPGDRVFVADTKNRMVRSIIGGNVSTVAGNGSAGFADGVGTAAMFFGLEGLAAAPNGRSVVVADGSGGEAEPYHRVRRIDL